MIRATMAVAIFVGIVNDTAWERATWVVAGIIST